MKIYTLYYCIYDDTMGASRVIKIKQSTRYYPKMKNTGKSGPQKM